MSAFIIMKDTPIGPASVLAPVFRAYVDNTLPDGNAYNACRKMLECWMDETQPDDVAGVWWVGKLPTTTNPYSYDSGLYLERFTVEYSISITG